MKSKFSQIIVLLFVLINIVLFSSCYNGTKDYRTNPGEYNIQEDPAILDYFDPSMPEGIFEFTHSILNKENFSRIIPLGQVNPPDHTFPTDHIYFVLSMYRAPVFAPTGGKIVNIEEPSGDYGDGAIRIAITNTMTYYLGHILANENLKVGDMIEAGEEIAVSGNTECVDFGLLNRNIDNGFVNIRRVPIVTIFGDKPLSYYREPLRSELYNLVQPMNESPGHDYDYDFVYDKGVTDGKFAYDVAGTLSGNWVWEEGILPGGWYDNESTLSFARHNFYPDYIIIGVGKHRTAYVLKNEDNPIKPEEVTAESGIVTYKLFLWNTAINGVLPEDTPNSVYPGKMIVQVLSDTRIRVEFFGDLLTPSEFTSASLYYIRWK